MFGIGSSIFAITFFILLIFFYLTSFIYIGKQFKWRTKGIIALLFIIFISGLLGVTLIGSIMSFTFGPKQVSLKDASAVVGFEIYVPQYLPEKMRLDSTEVLPTGTNKTVVLRYIGSEKMINIEENKSKESNAMIDLRMTTRIRKIKINGLTALLADDDSGRRVILFNRNGTAIAIDAYLSEKEIIKVAGSLAPRERK